MLNIKKLIMKQLWKILILGPLVFLMAYCAIRIGISLTPELPVSWDTLLIVALVVLILLPIIVYIIDIDGEAAFLISFWPAALLLGGRLFWQLDLEIMNKASANNVLLFTFLFALVFFLIIAFSYFKQSSRRLNNREALIWAGSHFASIFLVVMIFELFV